MLLVLFLALMGRTIMDIFFKYAVQHTQSLSPAQAFRRIVSSGFFWAGSVFSVINFCLWLKVLSNYDLSFVYPFFSISFVLVMISGWLFFKETLDMKKWVGMGIVLVGSLSLTVA